MAYRAAGIILWMCAGAAWAQPSHDSCVDVQVGSAQSYACINQQLQGVAREAQKSSGAAPYTAQSPANQTGQFNEAATRERLGGNFGKSVTPVRPAGNYPGAFGSKR
jgi:hypothetical protein